MQDYTHSYFILQHNASWFMLTELQLKENCNAALFHTGALQATESGSPALESTEDFPQTLTIGKVKLHGTM